MPISATGPWRSCAFCKRRSSARRAVLRPRPSRRRRRRSQASATRASPRRSAGSAPACAATARRADPNPHANIRRSARLLLALEPGKEDKRRARGDDMAEKSTDKAKKTRGVTPSADSGRRPNTLVLVLGVAALAALAASALYY